MFDPSLKKKKPKKKQVVFNEEPAEPPKETRDPSPVPTPGPSILKPSSEDVAVPEAVEERKEKAGVPEDLGFGDLKKKKRKEKIPLDFVRRSFLRLIIGITDTYGPRFLA